MYIYLIEKKKVIGKIKKKKYKANDIFVFDHTKYELAVLMVDKVDIKANLYVCHLAELGV